jgi:hypothetical protein
MSRPLEMVPAGPLPAAALAGTGTTPVMQIKATHPDHIGQIGAALGALALLMSIATVLQANSNGGLQSTATQGQAQVAKAQALANVDNELVGLLAKAAAENHDEAIRSLLAANGVTFKATPTVGSTAASVAAPVTN